MGRGWEYTLIGSGALADGGVIGARSADREAIEVDLNRLADDGWEIVGMDLHEPAESSRLVQALARRER
jgi:hypothetical protein